MRQHALSYINDIVEMMGNALLGRVYDLESRHYKRFEKYVDQANLQLLAISDLTKKVNDMVIDRDGLVGVDAFKVDTPGFSAAEAGPSAAGLLDEHARTLEPEELVTYEVRGTGWI